MSSDEALGEAGNPINLASSSDDENPVVNLVSSSDDDSDSSSDDEIDLLLKREVPTAGLSTEAEPKSARGSSLAGKSRARVEYSSAARTSIKKHKPMFSSEEEGSPDNDEIEREEEMEKEFNDYFFNRFTLKQTLNYSMFESIQNNAIRYIYLFYMNCVDMTRLVDHPVQYQFPPKLKNININHYGYLESAYYNFKNILKATENITDIESEIWKLIKACSTNQKIFKASLAQITSINNEMKNEFTGEFYEPLFRIIQKLIVNIKWMLKIGEYYSENGESLPTVYLEELFNELIKIYNVDLEIPWEDVEEDLLDDEEVLDWTKKPMTDEELRKLMMKFDEYTLGKYAFPSVSLNDEQRSRTRKHNLKVFQKIGRILTNTGSNKINGNSKGDIMKENQKIKEELKRRGLALKLRF